MFGDPRRRGRGRMANLRRYAPKAYDRVARAGGMKCGKSPRGAKKRVCIATDPIPGMKCGLNRINKLYACVAVGHGGGRRRRRR
jgi:hypothetical protein